MNTHFSRPSAAGKLPPSVHGCLHSVPLKNGTHYLCPRSISVTSVVKFFLNLPAESGYPHLYLDKNAGVVTGGLFEIIPVDIAHH